MEPNDENGAQNPSANSALPPQQIMLPWWRAPIFMPHQQAVITEPGSNKKDTEKDGSEETDIDKEGANQQVTPGMPEFLASPAQIELGQSIVFHLMPTRQRSFYVKNTFLSQLCLRVLASS